MFKCEVCRISLNENDLPSHNNGKRHLKNLVRHKLHLKPVVASKDVLAKENTNKKIKDDKAMKDDKSMNDDKMINDDKIINNDKMINDDLIINNDKMINDDQITNNDKMINDNKMLKGNEINPENYAIIPTNSKEKDASIKTCTKTNDSKTPTQDKKYQQQQDTSKRRPKRKLKEESPRAAYLPFIFVNNLLTFDQQVINFVMQVEQTQNEWGNIKWVLHDIEFTFGHVIPGVKPVLYGSSFSGLAFKTSDIDVYLYDPRGGEPDRGFIQRDGGIIYRFRLFTNIVRIPNARVPVIKATHVGTGIDLDISATSGQAVANSRLIRFLISYDWRIRSLMMLIGYLGKKFTLIGINKFSRYSINLLIIFYLQNLATPILPPLCRIVYGVPERTWPFAFHDNTFSLINNNKQHLAELFMGFFEFFVDFDFSKHVISTYLGEKVVLEDMEKEEFLDKMIFYKNYLKKGGEKLVKRNICIQDPLELNHNTTKGITEKVLSQFKFIFSNAIQIKQKVDEREWLTEMLKMEYIPPFVEKVGSGQIPFIVRYNFDGDDLIPTIKQALELVFSTIGMELDWNHPVVEDDNKKTKLSPGLTFSIETRKSFFPKGLKWSINQLKDGNYNLKELKKALVEISEIKHQTVFCALCFVSFEHPKELRVTMKNNCTHRMFFRILPILRSSLEVLLKHALLEITKTSNDSDIASKETKDISESINVPPSA